MDGLVAVAPMPRRPRRYSGRGEVMPSHSHPLRRPSPPGHSHRTRSMVGWPSSARQIDRSPSHRIIGGDCEMSQISVCFWSVDLHRSNQANPFPPASVFPSSPSSAHTPHTCPCFHRALSSWTTDATAVPVACASLLFYSCSFFLPQGGLVPPDAGFARYLS